MARLSKHGTQLFAVSKTEDSVNDPTVTKKRTTYAYMSDGTRLSKFDIWFAPDTYNPKGRFHTYGWKLNGKFARTDIFSTAQMIREQYLKDPKWTEG